MPMLGGGGGLVNECTSNTCGGGVRGSIDEDACDMREGEGGGEGGGGGGGVRPMGDTSGLGVGIKRK